MKHLILVSAIALVIGMPLCAQQTLSKTVTLSGTDSDTTKCSYKQIVEEDGTTIHVMNSGSSTKKVTSMTITKNGNENGNTMYVVKSDGKATIITSLEAELKHELPVLTADSMPQFPGGMSAMMTYLMENVKYPEDAKKAQKDGRVICSFVIDKSGKVTEAHVVQSSGVESMDNEALRVVNNMPDWTPGTNNGEPVSVLFTIPVHFMLK